ncbi:MAG: biotin--[acetyl-CoA-carboxylase] ligase [Muribaculaceae bacterium]|nr:biotin--[acetyl-CoA-carboxylase] ligase [Muribaculaceae bacterium]
MRIFELEETASTNTWVTANRDSLPMPSLVFARRQTAGRGQRGNSWESEPDKNLCCSIFLRPEGVEPRSQFTVSEAVALAVVDLLAHYGVEAKVKWPNDIYVGDRKICGILIENAITPREILHTIAGIGVNLNQERFISDAPNPVSLTQLTGREYDIPEAAALLADSVERRLEMAMDEPEPLHKEFMTKMWRGDGGRYPFLDRLRGERIEASIAGVAPDGILTLDLGNEQRSYAFKEIEFLLRG